MSAPKRVLIFSLTYFPFVGGAEVAVKEITDRILPQDIEFDMITLRFSKELPEREKIGNVWVHRVGFTKKEATAADTFRSVLALNKYLYPFIAYRLARKLHAKHYYDALWSIQANYAGFATLFTKWTLRHVPFILTLQEGNPPSRYKWRVGPLYPLYRRIFTTADMVQPISYFLANFARDMGYGGPMEVIPNGVDVKEFSQKPSTTEVERARTRLKKKQNERYIITVSRLTKKNAIDDIIASLAYLPEHVKLLVVGVGPDGEKLYRLAKKLGVEKRVAFLGWDGHDMLPPLFALSDVFVRPSLSEGQGISFLEAMAAGVPVVATPVGGIPDFLFDPRSGMGKVTPTGLFCEVRDPKSIATQVKRLLDDEKLCNRLIQNAQKMVTEKYDWWRIVNDMRERVFNKVMKHS